MKIYDISQEVFGCTVFPGDPSPVREKMMQIEKGDVCTLTGLKMCAHNGTHVDAPFHFIDAGKTIDQVALDKFIGYAYVAEHEGSLSAEDAEKAGEGKFTFKVDQVSLRYVLISEKNEYERGLLVPVWSFEGVCYDTHDNVYARGSFLQINAVDGTVYNAQLGY